MRSSVKVLADPRADRRLRRDGFVRTRLLSADEAASLRDEYLALDPPAGQGFVPDLNIEDPRYRAAADVLLGARLDLRVQGLFVDHRPFLRNFLCKHPGDESGLYLHRDWMFVDERRGPGTYVVWTALQDIDGHNGQLRVLRGSHRIDQDIRGTEIGPPWLRHQDTITERLLTVPVKAGECIIFSNALIHSSFPNNTDERRIVAAMGMRPTGQPLAHFRRTGPDTAVRYEIDERFFLTYTPVDLIGSPPALEPAETIRFTATDLTSDELAAAVERGLVARLDRRHRATAR